VRGRTLTGPPRRSSLLLLKIVTRRPPGEDVLRDSAILQRRLNALRGNALVPRGVYRFASHEEADAWMTLRIAATHARQSSGTSPQAPCPRGAHRSQPPRDPRVG